MRCKTLLIMLIFNNCNDYQSDFFSAYQYYVDNFNSSNYIHKIDENVINFFDAKISKLIDKLRQSETKIDELIQANETNQFLKQILPKISDKNLKNNILNVFRTSNSYCNSKDIMNFLNVFYIKMNNEQNKEINNQIFDIIMGTFFFISHEEILMTIKTFSVIKQYCSDDFINNIIEAVSNILKNTKTNQQVQTLSISISKKIQEISNNINISNILSKINSNEIKAILQFRRILGIFAQVYFNIID